MFELSTNEMPWGLPGLPVGVVEGDTIPELPVLMAMLCWLVGDEGVEFGERREEHGRWCWVLGDGRRS